MLFSILLYIVLSGHLAISVMKYPKLYHMNGTLVYVTDAADFRGRMSLVITG